MKNQRIAFKKRLLPAVVVMAIGLYACQSDFETPIMSCPEMSMVASVQGSIRSMNLSTSTLFRQQMDSGGVKFLSMEAVSDSFKLVINLVDGTYPDNILVNDSIRLKTYQYSKAAGIQGGLVVAAINNLGDYNYLTTDTSSITITRLNTKLKTVSGKFYFEASNHKVSGSGTFQNTCYVSLP